MISRSFKIKIVLYGILLFLLFPKPTYAYLDPGTGSYFFQLVIAGLLGSSFFIKAAISKIKKFFKK
jgi:hypothetical protein